MTKVLVNDMKKTLEKSCNGGDLIIFPCFFPADDKGFSCEGKLLLFEFWCSLFTVRGLMDVCLLLTTSEVLAYASSNLTTIFIDFL